MLRYGAQFKTAILGGTLLCTGLVVAVGFGACADGALGPEVESDPTVFVPGVNVYLEVSRAAAPPGSRVLVTARIKAIDVERTPTGFAVDLSYDHEKLRPLEVAALDDGVLRAVNLEAAPGLVKAAGAAPDGITSDVLFEIAFAVLAREYTENLALSVHELTVLEENFADVAFDVVTPPQVLTVQR